MDIRELLKLRNQFKKLRSRIGILDEELYNEFKEYYKGFNGSVGFREALNDFINSLNLDSDSRRYVRYRLLRAIRRHSSSGKAKYIPLDEFLEVLEETPIVDA